MSGRSHGDLPIRGGRGGGDRGGFRGRGYSGDRGRGSDRGSSRGGHHEPELPSG